jgi:hypothetical protein
MATASIQSISSIEQNKAESKNDPSSRIKVLDTSNISDIIEIGCIEISRCSNSPSGQRRLAVRGPEAPKLKPVLPRSPLNDCINGVMIGRNQAALGDWLDHGMKKLLATPQSEKTENSILVEYHGIISKL